MKKWVVPTILFTVLVSACETKGKKTMDIGSFKDDLVKHLKAIQDRNIDDLEPTVDDDVSMIGPDGNMLDSKKVFMDFHNEWFKLKNWKWKGNILKIESSDSLGYGLVQ